MDARSPFQLLDWRIASFAYTNQKVYVKEDQTITWKLRVAIDYQQPEREDKLASILTISFEAKDDDEEKGFKMNGLCASFCEFEIEDRQNSQQVFDQLMKRTATLNSLANLRIFLMNQGTLLSVPAGKLIIPHFDLNKISMNEDITFTT